MTENMPTVNARSSHARAHERRDEQRVRLVRDAGEREGSRPAADGARAEHRHRLAHRADPLRAGEDGGVGVAQELVAQADVTHDRALEVLELDARRDVGQRAEGREALRRDGAAGHDLGLGDERALEGGEAELAAHREVGVRVDRGRDEDEVATAQRLDLRPQAVGAEGGEVELHAPRGVEQRLEAGAVDVAVDRDARAARRKPRDRLVQGRVVAVGGGPLEHDAVRADRHGPDVEEQVAAERQPGGVAAGERVEADLRERLDDRGDAVDEELEAEQAHLRVEHGLARDEDLAGRGCRSGCGRASHVARSSSRSTDP